MDFPVPQFIEIEERILGPLSLKQTMFLIVAVGLIFILYFFLETWLHIILSLLILGIAGSFAFIRIGGRTLGQFISSVIAFAFMPRMFVWKKTEKANPTEIKLLTQKVKSKMGVEEKIIQELKEEESKKGGLKEITKRIDLGIKTKNVDQPL